MHLKYSLQFLFFLKCAITMGRKFFHVKTTISIKQTNQPNLDGLLTLNCFSSNVIPNGKLVRNGCIWFWGYVHLEPWLSLDPGICLWQPPWVGSSVPALRTLQLLKETSSNKNINFIAPQQNLGNLQLIRNVFGNLILIQYGLKPHLKITTLPANQKRCVSASSNYYSLCYFFIKQRL